MRAAAAKETELAVEAAVSSATAEDNRAHTAELEAARLAADRQQREAVRAAEEAISLEARAVAQWHVDAEVKAAAQEEAAKAIAAANAAAATRVSEAVRTTRAIGEAEVKRLAERNAALSRELLAAQAKLSELEKQQTLMTLKAQGEGLPYEPIVASRDPAARTSSAGSGHSPHSGSGGWDEG